MKKRKAQFDAFTSMSLSVARYLKTLGWYMVMSGPAQVEQEPTARKFDYRFVLMFTGGKRNVEMLSRSPDPVVNSPPTRRTSMAKRKAKKQVKPAKRSRAGSTKNVSRPEVRRRAPTAPPPAQPPEDLSTQS